jgi:hypothetical protein
MAKMAKDVEQLKWFIKISADYEPHRDILLHAIGLLQKTSEKDTNILRRNLILSGFNGVAT